MNNKERVDKWRKRTGNERHKSIYSILTNRYGVPSRQAQKMKSWGKERIVDYLDTNGFELINPHFCLTELWE